MVPCGHTFVMCTGEHESYIFPILWEHATVRRIYIPRDLLWYKVISMLEIVEPRKVI